MAQASKFTMTSTSESVGIPANYADRIYHLAPWETPIVTAVGLDSLPTPCTNPVYHYIEIEDRPARTTLDGSISSGDTSFTFSEAVFAAGEVVQINEETILLGTTSDNKTFAGCTRSHGAGADADHSDAAPVTSLGKPRAQGFAASSTGDRIIQGNDVTNYTQIFAKDVVVSGTSQAVYRYGREGDEVSYQEMFQQKVLKKELQNAFLWGVDTAAATTATAGEMDGIYERLATPSSADLGDGALQLADVEDAVEAAMDYGARPNIIAVGLYTKRVIDSWGVPYVKHDTDPMSSTNMTYGTNVTKLYVGGVELDVLVCSDLHAHVFVMDANRLGLGPLASRAFFKKDLDDGGDRKKSQIIGEYTCAVPNPHSHYVFTSVKFS